MVSFGDAVRLFYKRYFDFQGRSQRSEYWWFQLFVVLVALVFSVVISVLGGGLSEGSELNVLGMVLIAALGIFFLGHFIGMIALSVRRFHDLGQTGWLVLVFALVSAIPLVGLIASIAQIVWFIMRGNVGDNKYGPDPLV